MKLLLLTAMAGHILCGITDCLFTYGSKGKVEWFFVRMGRSKEALEAVAEFF